MKDKMFVITSNEESSKYFKFTSAQQPFKVTCKKCNRGLNINYIKKF